MVLPLLQHRQGREVEIVSEAVPAATAIVEIHGVGQEGKWMDSGWDGRPQAHNCLPYLLASGLTHALTNFQSRIERLESLARFRLLECPPSSPPPMSSAASICMHGRGGRSNHHSSTALLQQCTGAGAERGGDGIIPSAACMHAVQGQGREG